MSTGADSALRLRTQGAVLIVIIFVVGVLAGGAGERIRASRGKPMRPFRQPGELPRPFARLDLTEEQQAELSLIFESAGPRTDSVLQELMPRLQVINDSIQEQIREILTPEQLESNVKLVQYLADRHETIEYLIGHFEYLKFEGSSLFIENYPGYRTKKDAERARADLLSKLDRGEYVEPSHHTVGDFLVEPAARRASWRGARSRTARACRRSSPCSAWRTCRSSTRTCRTRSTGCASSWNNATPRSR